MGETRSTDPPPPDAPAPRENAQAEPPLTTSCASIDAEVAARLETDPAFRAKHDAIQIATLQREVKHYHARADGAFETIKARDAEIATLQARVEAAERECAKLYEDIEAFNKHDHDREGAAEVWHDLYREYRERVEAAEQQIRLLIEERDALAARVRELQAASGASSHTADRASASVSTVRPCQWTR